MSRFALALLVAGLCAVAATAATVSSLPYKEEMRLHPFSKAPVPDYYVLDGATVSIEEGYVRGLDKLSLDYEGAFPIDATFNTKTGVLNIEGESTISEYTQAIQSVVFTSTSTDGNTRRITWSFGNNTIFSTRTQHFYKSVSSLGVPWGDAKKICDSRITHMGMKGYLATVTSDVELTALGGRLPFTAWLGGMSNMQAVNTTAKWSWQSGPESMETFWNGANIYMGGTSGLTDSFNGWGRFQPQPSDEARPYVALIPSAFEAVSYFYNKANVDGIEGYVCEFGGTGNSTLASETAISRYSGTVLLELSCALYTTETDCKNRVNFGCNWAGSRCDKVSCGRYMTQFNCNSDDTCAWDTTGDVGKCVNTHCSKYANGAACNSDPLCSFVTRSGVEQCVMSMCNDKTSSCTCAAQSTECLWRKGRCNYGPSIECDKMDIVYVMDSSAATAGPFGLFTAGYLGEVDVMLKTQQVLTNTRASVAPDANDFGSRVGFINFASTASKTPAGTGSSGQLTGDYAERRNDLLWHRDGYSAGNDVRNGAPALKMAKNMFDAGSASRTKVVIVTLGGALSDEIESRAEVAALKAANITVVFAALQATPQGTVASMNAEKSATMVMPNTMLSMPLSAFQKQVMYGLCSTMFAGAAVAHSSGVVTCTRHAAMTDCANDVACAWSYSASQCQRSQCAGKCGMSACNDDATCNWDGNSCVEKCPGLSMAQCAAATAECTLQGSTCVAKPCVSNPTEDACIADPAKCVYNASSAIKCMPVTCTFTDPSTCSNTFGCFWSKSCAVDPCVYQRTSSDCIGLKQCEWAATAGKCQRNSCGNFADESTCASKADCEWDVTVSPPACAPGMCAKYNHLSKAVRQNECQMDSACKWQTLAENGVGDRCVVKTCDMMSSSCTCAAMDGCVWRNDQCKDARYVQCPMVDLVFLVEGTPLMQEDFSRHPSGFAGIMESLRDWSRMAPLAASLTNTGFRLGLSVYGAANTPFTVSDTVELYGGTGDAFHGVNGVIDQFLEKLKDYKAGTASALKPGLLQVQKIFDKASDPSRKRMLVILGSSPITDEGFGYIINDLEAKKVQIFSNVIRRFSTITPKEQKAANYLMPIASDPPRAHFLFSTIDAIRSSLLDNFCDPSTLTGKALGVSRDRTLPCDWLSGKQECEMQASCTWNGTASPTCTSPGLCPNLECVKAPNGFECHECERGIGGVLSCSKGTVNHALPGLCQKSACASAHCTSAACDGNAQCNYNTSSSRCDNKVCTAGDETGCNNMAGCVWQGGNCVISACWQMRSAQSCNGLLQSNADGVYQPCRWATENVPAVCEEMRCPYFESEPSCASHPLCWWNRIKSSRQCTRKACAYTNSEQCISDAGCYWNPYDSLEGECMIATDNCQLSKYSDWSECTATCGNAVRVKSRRILQFPKNGGRSCKIAAETCAPGDTNCNAATDKTIVVSQKCAWPGQPTRSNCTNHCATYLSNVQDCSNDISCEWKKAACRPKAFRGCGALDRTACGQHTDMCNWDTTLDFCIEIIGACRYDTQAQCQGINNCMWRTGMTSNSLAATLKVPVTLFNPGQTEVFPFPTLAAPGRNEIVKGASVVIEQGYQRGMDLLDLNFPSTISTKWLVQSGTLMLHGNGTMEDFIKAIRYVTFKTTATSTEARVLSWSLGENVVRFSQNNHHYQWIRKAGVTWPQARAECSKLSYYGSTGYLATVSSEDENTVIATKLAGDGWLSGDDAQTNTWRWSTGPENGVGFWRGGSSLVGGLTVTGQFANWNPVSGEPVVSGVAGTNHVYLNISGYWSAKSADDTDTTGFVCEFGGMPGDIAPAFVVGGSTVMGPGGCVPKACQWHDDESSCNMDAECSWSGTQCISGCASRSTQASCASASERCAWDTAVLPPVCDANPCSPLGTVACDQHPRCRWSVTNGCQFATGCAAVDNAEECDGVPACHWSSNFCQNKPCSSMSTAQQCATNPLCEYGSSGCVSLLCRFPSEKQCTADRKCTWSSVQAVHVGFSPAGDFVFPFATGIPRPAVGDDVDGITVMITQGFRRNEDILSVIPDSAAEAGFTAKYDQLRGVLVLSAATGLKVKPSDAFTFLQTKVRFSSTSKSDGLRTITYAYGSNTVASNDGMKFLRWLPLERAQTFAQAADVCKMNKYAGAAGMLAAVSDEVDNMNIARLRAQGWIGAGAGSTNEWTWTSTSGVAGPTVFWKVVNTVGRPVANPNMTTGYNFAQWAGGEPKQVRGAAWRYGFMLTSGQWSSVSDNSPSIATGVMCEYKLPSVGGTMMGQRVAKPEGCFVAPCLSLDSASCRANAACAWVIDGNTRRCAQDTWCATQPTLTGCGKRAGCYWDYSNGVCRLSPPNVCSGLPQVNCTSPDFAQCTWNADLTPQPTTSAPTTLGACVFSGCITHQLQATCTSDPKCMWYEPASAATGTGQCIERVCGYPDKTACWSDQRCEWSSAQGQCTASVCLDYTQGSCAGQDGCEWSASLERCQHKRCATTAGGLEACQADSMCLWSGTGCSMPACAQYTSSQKQCNAQPSCFFFIRQGGRSECQPAQCTVYTTELACTKGVKIVSQRPCIWEAGKCRQPTFLEQNAPTQVNSCEKEVEPSLWWLWVLVALIVIVIGLICWRLYLAYSRGLSFVEPTRKNVKYSPHAQYAADLFEEADEQGDFEDDNNNAKYAGVNDL